MSKAEEILKEYESTNYHITHNSMGCDERWYDSVYAVCSTFSREELLNMSDYEVNNLLKLASNMSEAFY